MFKKENPNRKRNIAIAVIIALALIGLAAGAYYLLNKKAPEPVKTEQVTPPPVAKPKPHKHSPTAPSTNQRLKDLEARMTDAEIRLHNHKDAIEDIHRRTEKSNKYTGDWDYQPDYQHNYKNW